MLTQGSGWEVAEFECVGAGPLAPLRRMVLFKPSRALGGAALLFVLLFAAVVLLVMGRETLQVLLVVWELTVLSRAATIQDPLWSGGCSCCPVPLAAPASKRQFTCSVTALCQGS